MAYPSRPTKYNKATAGFRSMSDEDFARLSTEEKFEHVHLGMRELTQALVELAAATTSRAAYMANDLCAACICLVGGDRNVAPHLELQQVKRSADEKLYQCVSCEAWWSVQKLGWARLPLTG